MSHWLAEGRTLGASLRRFTCIVVAGPDREATAEVALGIAEAQAAHRRVVLGDLLDDAPPFASFRVDDDHHGLVDTLHYGTSLARIARPVAGTDGLHFAPTGSDITDYAELLAHPRWSRLIQSFAESGEMLVIAAPANAPGLDDLVMHTDGVVLVDGQVPAKVDPVRVIAQVRGAPRPVPSPPVPRPPFVPAGAAAAATAPGALRPRTVAATVNPAPTKTPPRRSTAPVGAPRMSNQTAKAKPSVAVNDDARTTRTGTAAGEPIPGLNRSVVVGSLLTLVAALFIYWLAERPAAESESPTHGTVGAAPLLKTKSSGADRTASDPNIVDPADSGAAAFAVQIMAANTQAGAILKLQEHGSSLPAATYAPIAIQGTTWFKVVAGAFATRGGADSLLASLRADRLLDSTEGVVVHMPFSLRIDSVRAAATVSDLLAQLRVGRNLPVYALLQRNGWVWVMVGAFETRSQADMYAETLRSVGLTPQLVYRQGRLF